MRVVTLLPFWVISITKNKENLNKFKSIIGINNFFKIKIQDYKTTDRIFQCFKCQQFGHKSEFCHIKDRCVKCAGQHNTRDCKKDATHPARCVNCDGQHSTHFQGCPEAKKFKERRGTTRTSLQASTSREAGEFPELPRRQQEEQPCQETTGGGLEDFREILNLLRSRTISSNVWKFRELLRRFKQQCPSS